MSRPAFWIDALALGIICIICAQFFEQLFLFAIIWLVYDILAILGILFFISCVFVIWTDSVALVSVCDTLSPWPKSLVPKFPVPMSPEGPSSSIHIHPKSYVSCVKVVVPNPLVTKCPKSPSPLVLILKKYATLCHGRPGGATSEGHMRWWGEMGRLGRGWMRRL